MKGKDIIIGIALLVVGYVIYKKYIANRLDNTTLTGIISGFINGGETTTLKPDTPTTQISGNDTSIDNSIYGDVNTPSTDNISKSATTTIITHADISNFSNSEYQQKLHAYREWARQHPKEKPKASPELLKMSRIYGIKHNPKYRHKRIISKTYYPKEWAEYEYYAKGNASEEVKKILGLN